MEPPHLQTTRPDHRNAPPDRRLWRGFLVALILLPLNTLWGLYMEHISGQGPFVSTISLFFNVIFIIALVAILNAALRRLSPRLALNRAELIIVYVMLTIGASLAGHDMLQVLISVMTVGYWFATPQNRWEQILDGTVPPWLVITDKQALYDFWNGSSTLYRYPLILTWLEPILWWAGFILVLLFVLVCMSVILRPLWADRERLTFPIIQLPLELTNPNSSLLRNRFMWIGFGVAAALDLINGLNYIFPSVPAIPTYLTLNIQNWPWNGVGWTPITFPPSVIGLSFLMPLDLLFSCTFFYWWWKAMFVIATATGVSTGYGWGSTGGTIFPYANEQMFGGFVAIAFSSILIGRSYFKQLQRRVIGAPSEIDDSKEGLPLRTAVIGVIIGIALLIFFSLHAGMSLAIAASTFLIYYVLAMAVARIRAEFGSPVHDFHHTGPDYTLTTIIGPPSLRHEDLGMLSLFFWFNRAYRGHPVANSIEGLQMSARARSPSRPIVLALILATILGTFAAFWCFLHFAYIEGAADWGWGSANFGRETFGRLQSWTESPKESNLVTPIAMAAGFLITLLLAFARSSFAGWPLHPVAYALSSSWSINLVWTPMLIAWIAKAAVLRYGGLQFYRKVLPVSYGLILGESIVGCGWSLVGLIFRVPNYNFFGF
jgi:hypothetical protein